MLKGRGEKLKLSLGVVLVFRSQQVNHSMQLLGQVCPCGIFADCGLWSEMKGGLGGTNLFSHMSYVVCMSRPSRSKMCNGSSAKQD